MMSIISSTTHRFERISLPNWFTLLEVIAGLYVLLPFLVLLLMAIGWGLTGKAIYFVYSFFCHQLPERSFFLLGPKLTYDLPQIQAAWQDTNNSLILRQFIGSPEFPYLDQAFPNPQTAVHLA
jgi:hypothetical protein